MATLVSARTNQSTNPREAVAAYELPLGVFGYSPEKLGEAVGRLKIALANGLAFEKGAHQTDDMTPAEKRAVELWFGTDD